MVTLILLALVLPLVLVLVLVRFMVPRRVSWNVEAVGLCLLCSLQGNGANPPGAFPEYQPESARDYLESVARLLDSQLAGKADTAFALARIRAQLGETDDAKRLARKALEQDPSRADIHSFLAGLFIHEDHMEEAAASLREAVRLKPGATGDQRRLGMVLDRLGDRAAAQAAFETTVRLAPKDATARLLLGRLLLDQGQPDAAADHLRTACELDPTQAGAFYALSEAQTALGQPEAAEESLKMFRHLKQQERAAYDVQHRTYDDERYMRELVSGFHTEMASLLVRQQEPALAEAHLRQATRIAPDAPAAYEILAVLLLQSGRRAEARETCATLVRINPNQVNYRVNLGTLLLQLNEPTAAAEELRRALELDPRQPEAMNNLARHYLGTRQDLPDALALSQRLVEVRPTAASYDLLGWASYVNGLTNHARAAAARAVELDPQNPAYRQRLQRLGGAP